MLHSHHQPWRGRGRGKGSYQNRRGATRNLYPPPPLGDVLATISLGDLKDLADEETGPAQIINSQYLVSYNWLDRTTHTILVPGRYLHPYTLSTYDFSN
jgi:hypothetical protein